MAKTRPSDLSKPLPTIKVDTALHYHVRACCAQLVMNPTTLVNQAVREFLHAHKLWPPEEAMLLPADLQEMVMYITRVRASTPEKELGLLARTQIESLYKVVKKESESEHGSNQQD